MELLATAVRPQVRQRLASYYSLRFTGACSHPFPRLVASRRHRAASGEDAGVCKETKTTSSSVPSLTVVLSHCRRINGFFGPSVRA